MTPAHSDAHRTMPKPNLDELDRRLLTELAADARLTQAALGARLGISRSSVQERIKRLEREGVIQGYTLRLGQERKVGIRAYLLVKGGANHERLVRTLEAFPEVQVADSVSGDTDLVLQVEGERLEDINQIRDEVGRFPGVTSTQTLLVLAPRFDRR